MQATILTGDLQGRSVHLGPDKVIIESHSQPDVVLGLPPMHVDWIDTVGQLTGESGCGSDEPCIANLTVIPTKQSPAVGFQSSFKWQTKEIDKSVRKSTESYTAGIKVDASGRVTVGSPWFEAGPPHEMSEGTNFSEMVFRKMG